MDAPATKLLLRNVGQAKELGGIAKRKAKPNDYKSVRDALVAEEVAKGWVVEKNNKTSSRLRRPKPFDRVLEDRVWTLLYRMGFKHLSEHGGAHVLLNEKDPESPENQVDVVALDDDVAIAIECKASASPKKLTSFTSDLAKHVHLRDRFTKAVASQFPSAHKRPSIFAFWTENIILSDNDAKRADADKVVTFSETDLAYYEQLVSEIGVAARFQFLADILPNRPIPGLEVKVPAIRSKMGSALAYTFSVSPEYLLKIAFVSHRARGKASDIDAYQRLLKKSRLKSIREYIDDDGFFPTNIVVNIAQKNWLQFDRGKQETDEQSRTLFGWLTIRPAFKVAWIIDGQHRLYAYANHQRAQKSLISVMAFVGLEPSEQARLFIDINGKQRKVKQSLLQELYAELHWDAEDPNDRIQAVLSKVVQSLDSQIGGPLQGRILKADEPRTEDRCISLTSLYRALEKTEFFIARIKNDEVQEYGPLWGGSNNTTLKRTIKVLGAYFDVIRAEASAVWNRGSADGGGLAMNDGVTVCIELLRSIVSHLQRVKNLKLSDFSDEEIAEVVAPYAKQVGQYFASLTDEQMRQFRALRGVQGQTAGRRRIEEVIHKKEPAFNPTGLSDYITRAKTETSKRAFEKIQAIESLLQKYVLEEIREEYGKEETEWWFGAVPKGVRKKVDDRINEEGGRKGGRAENIDLIDYRDIALQNWALFENTLAYGKSGNKEARTKWIVEVNELRKPVMHASKGTSLPISEEEVSRLEEIYDWLEGRISGPDDEEPPPA